MKQTTIAECKEKVGFAVEGVTGIVTKLFPRETKEKPSKSGGTYVVSWQNGELSDESGSVKFTLWGVDEMSTSHRGKQVSFLSSKGRGGWNGVLVEENEYKGNKTIQLNIDKNAKFVEGTPEQAFEGNQDAQQSSVKAPVSGLEPHNLIPLPKANQNNPQVNVGESISKYGKLYLICLRQADTVIKDSNLSEEDLRELSTTFFIQAVKSGLLDHIEVNEEVTEAF